MLTDREMANVLTNAFVITEEDEMKDHDRLVIGRSWLRMYESLCQAVENAGGRGFPLREFESMSTLQLFNHLATNNVRFYCTKTHHLVENPRQSIDPRYHCKGSGDLKEESKNNT